MDWKKKLQDAKDMLENGILDQKEFEQLKANILAEVNTQPNKEPLPQQIGAYQIFSLIGEGGMGVVYKARHRNKIIAEKQGGDVALKVMHPQYAKKADFTERFDREASLGMKLDHSGIVRVFDLVMDSEKMGLVSEFVEGRPLSDIIGHEIGPMPWQRAWPIFKRILDAVEYAHSQGVVHRDIKPENIMVTSDENIKILDFGIAKDMDSSKTKTGTGMGTVAYMAPEQYINAKEVDHRADIYALGMTLYEMVAGQLPWAVGTTDFEVMRVKADGDLPTPTDYYPHIPKYVVESIQKSIVEDLNGRFQSVAELRSLLEAGGAASSTETSEETPPQTSSEEAKSEVVEAIETDSLSEEKVSAFPPLEPSIEIEISKEPEISSPKTEKKESPPVVKESLKETPPPQKSSKLLILVGVGLVAIIGLLGILAILLLDSDQEEEIVENSVALKSIRQPLKQDEFYIIASSLSVRLEADTAGERINLLPFGSVVKVRPYMGGAWYKLKDFDGYVFAEFLAKYKDSDEKALFLRTEKLSDTESQYEQIKLSHHNAIYDYDATIYDESIRYQQTGTYRIQNRKLIVSLDAAHYTANGQRKEAPSRTIVLEYSSEFNGYLTDDMKQTAQYAVSFDLDKNTWYLGGSDTRTWWYVDRRIK